MKENSDRRTIGWISAIAGPGKVWTLLLTVIRILQGACGVLYAYCLKRVVDSAVSAPARFSVYLALFGGLILLSLGLSAAGRHAAEKARCTLERAFRVHAFSRLLERDYGSLTAVHSGQWMNRITSDTAVISGTASSLLPEFTGSVVRLLGALAALILLMPRLAVILLPCGLLMLLGSHLLRKQLKTRHANAQQADGEARSFMQERLTGLLVIRTFAGEDAAAKRAGVLSDALAEARMRRARLSNLSGTVMGAVLMGAQFLGVALCGWGIVSGDMTYGTMSAILYLVNMLETPFARLSGYLSQYSAMIASAERLMEIEALPADPGCGAAAAENLNFDSLGLEGVTFRYPNGDAVLDRCSFTVKKGSFTAFTGSSGTGKSTAMKLLLSLYAPQRGRGFLQTADGRRIPLDASLRSLFAYVPQGNLLFSGTVRETVAFADPDRMADEAGLWNALEIACAREFVSDLPQGLDTPLGEGGSGLSEGQQQRLAIARAILSNRPVLLLDEATSALDADTETRLLRNLRSMTDRTVLLITHRTAALEHCDEQIRFDAITGASHESGGSL